MRLQPFTIYQPTYPAGIIWGHPLAEGLVSFVIGDHQVPVDLVTGNPGVAAAGTPRARSYLSGSAIEIGGTAATRYDFAYSPIYSGLINARTGWFSGQFNGTGVQALFGVNDDVPSLDGTPMLLYTSSAGTQAAFIASDGSGTFSWWRSGVNFPTGRPTSFVVSQAASLTGTPKFWVDGAFTTPLSEGPGPTTPNVTTDSKLRLGNRGGGGRQFAGLFAGGALWARDFTPTELQAFGEAPYQVFRPSAWRSKIRLPTTDYTMAADVGTFTLTGQAAGLNIGHTIAADTGTFTLTGSDAGLTVTTATPTAAGRVKKRRREHNAPAQFGNKDFLGSRRNSRPGVAEEEMREVLAAVKAKAVPIPLDAIEDDDEEAILWLV